MNEKLMETVKSRKFWFALVAAVVPVLNEQLGWNLDTTTVLGIVGSIIAWILGEAYMDGAKITTNPIKKEEIKPTEPVLIAPVTDKTKDELTVALEEMAKLENDFRNGSKTLKETQDLVNAWRAKYISYAMLVPPGFPGV